MIKSSRPCACHICKASRLVTASKPIGKLETNGPLRLYVALRILRAWNRGTAGYNANVVIAINRWIDDGMKGPVPWIDDPFFTQWAESNGLSRIGDAVGFRLTVDLSI